MANISPPVLLVLAVADKALRVQAQFLDLPDKHVIVAAYFLLADHSSNGIKKVPIVDLPETDTSPADLRLTRLGKREPVEVLLEGLTNGDTLGAKLEIMYRRNDSATAPVSFARSEGTVYATPAGLPPLAVIVAVKALTDTSFEVTLANPIFGNSRGDNGSRIHNVAVYLSNGFDETDPNGAIKNDVLVHDHPAAALKMYEKDAGGLVAEFIKLTVAGLDWGAKYEFSLAYASANGTGEYSLYQKLAQGTGRFGVAEDVVANGSDGKAVISFLRPKNYPIANFIGAVLENKADIPQNAMGAIYYLFNGSKMVLSTKDKLTGPGFPFDKRAAFRYELDVDNIQNNVPLRFALRLIGPDGEGLDLAEDISIIARASPSEIRNIELGEHMPASPTPEWLAEYKARSESIDTRFTGELRSAFISWKEPLLNWPLTGGKFTTVATIMNAIKAAENASVMYFFSERMDADRHLPAVSERNTEEKKLSHLQVLSLIQQIAGSNTRAQWGARSNSDKLSAASNFPKMVAAMEMYYNILKVSNELQTLANGAEGKRDLMDSVDSADNVFHTKDSFKIFLIPGVSIKVSLVASLVDAATGTILSSKASFIERGISARPSGLVPLVNFVAGNKDIKFTMDGFRQSSGVDIPDVRVLTLLKDSNGGVISTQSKTITLLKAVSGLPIEQSFSLAKDFGHIILNGGSYECRFESDAAIIDTLNGSSIPISSLFKISKSDLSPVGKMALAKIVVSTRSDSSVVAKIRALSLDEREGAEFSRFSTYLVAEELATNTKLKGFSTAQMDTFLAGQVIGPKFRAIRHLSNENNDVAGYIVTEPERLAKQDHTWSDAGLAKGTRFTSVHRAESTQPASNSDYGVDEPQQTYGAPAAPTSVVATPSGKTLQIRVSWTMPVDDGKAGTSGDNLSEYAVNLYTSPSQTATPLATVIVKDARRTFAVFDNINTNNQMVIAGSYFVTVQAFTRDFDGEAQPMKSSAVSSNVATLTITPTITSAVVTGNTVQIEWNTNGTSAQSMLYAFAVEDVNGAQVDGEFMGQIESVPATANSYTLTYTPAAPGYTLSSNGLIALSTTTGQLAFSYTGIPK